MLISQSMQGLCLCWHYQFSSVQSLSRVRLFATLWTAAHQASLSITNSRSPPKPNPLSRWCHPTISSSVVPFSSCPQSFPASRSFQMSQLSASGDKSIGVSASTSVPPMKTQDWSPLGVLTASEGSLAEIRRGKHDYSTRVTIKMEEELP